MIGFKQKLKSTDERNYFITSDLHFFHKNILVHCPRTRPFKDVDEMNMKLVEHINSTAGENDILFSLGDFSFAGKEKTQAIIDNINCNIVFILGNHCYKVFGNLPHKTHHYLEVNYDGTKICMSHYPIASWNNMGRGSVHAFGHVHGSYCPEGKCHDVGWDNNGKILSLDEFLEIVNNKPMFSPCHHKIVKEV